MQVYSNKSTEDLMYPKSVANIISNTPEIDVQFDQPEYVKLCNSSETKIEMDLIQNYLINPKCGKNSHTDETQQEHNYSLRDFPECYYFNSNNFCNICSTYFLHNLFLFNKHLMLHTERNVIECRICDQKFLTSLCLNLHLNSHKELCEACGKQVPKGQLKLHALLNKKQKTQKKDIQKYVVRKNLKVYLCVTCNKTFRTCTKYYDHLKEAHHKIEF